MKHVAVLAAISFADGVLGLPYPGKRLPTRSHCCDSMPSAVNPSGTSHANPQRVQIVIERWSTDAERSKLIEALQAKGSDDLLSTYKPPSLRPVIYKAKGISAGHIQYAREHPLPDGGRRIVVATDRPMAFAEAASGDRSSQYQFTLAEIRLPETGQGEGKLVCGCEGAVQQEDKTIAIEIRAVARDASRGSGVEGAART